MSFSASWGADIEHGTIEISSVGGTTQRTLSAAASPGVGLDEANTVLGKYFPTFSSATPVADGLLVTSAADLFLFGSPGTSMISVEGDQYAIPMRRPDFAAVTPHDLSAAIALFPYADWLA